MSGLIDALIQNNPQTTRTCLRSLGGFDSLGSVTCVYSVFERVFFWDVVDKSSINPLHENSDTAESKSRCKPRLALTCLGEGGLRCRPVVLQEDAASAPAAAAAAVRMP